MVVSAWVVYPCDHMDDWGPLLNATAQHHNRVSECILLAWEKIKIQRTVSMECVLLLNYYRVEKSLG